MTTSFSAWNFTMECKHIAWKALPWWCLFQLCVSLTSSFFECSVCGLLAMVYSTYKCLRILHLYVKGYKAPSIARLLHEERLSASRWGVDNFFRKYHETGAISRRPASGRPPKVIRKVKQLVEQQIRINDETTPHRLHALLINHRMNISFQLVLSCRSSFG